MVPVNHDERVKRDRRCAPAVALVLSGGILAAFAGPEAAVGAQSFPWLGLMEHLLHERHGLTDSLLRKEGRTAGPGHQRPRHLRRRGRGLPCLRLRVYGDRLGRARLRRLRPDGPGRRLPRGQLPRRVAPRRRPRGVEERLPQLHDLAYDGRLSRAGGHGGAVGEERFVDVVPLGRLIFISYGVLSISIKNSCLQK